jgi:hypothetical protein
MVDVVTPSIDDRTVVPFLQQAAPAVSFTIHANAITNTPRCPATGSIAS